MEKKIKRRKQPGLTREGQMYFEFLDAPESVSDFALTKEIVKEVTTTIKKNLQINSSQESEASAAAMLAGRRIPTRKVV